MCDSVLKTKYLNCYSSFVCANYSNSNVKTIIPSVFINKHFHFDFLTVFACRVQWQVEVHRIFLHWADCYPNLFDDYQGQKVTKRTTMKTAWWRPLFGMTFPT